MKRFIVIVVWAGLLALIWANGWTTFLWIYIGITVFLLFAGAVSRDEKDARHRKQRSFRGIYAGGAGSGSSNGPGDKTVPGRSGNLLSARYERQRIYQEAAENASAAEARRNRAD